SVNGRQTLSENIADLAGLAAALDAFHLACAKSPPPVVAGVCGDQQVFLAYAQSWREKKGETPLRRQLIDNGPTPPEYRADTVRNLDAWYAAFPVHAGDALYLPPSQRVKVW